MSAFERRLDRLEEQLAELDGSRERVGITICGTWPPENHPDDVTVTFPGWKAVDHRLCDDIATAVREGLPLPPLPPGVAWYRGSGEGV